MTSEPDKYMGRDVYTYTQEKERFQKELFQFHSGRRTHFLDLPTVNGKPVDLYRLYLMVTKHGGFHKVCDKNLWHLIPVEYFHFSRSCANAELYLKQTYMRYLYLFERVFIHGDDPDHPDDEDSTSRGARSGRILVHQVPMSYNFRLHNVHYNDRAHLGLSTNMARENKYERLEKSLLSGLPNEVDFAINVCCLMSVESPNSIKLLRHRNLIDLLLAHVGLFSHFSSLKPLYFCEWFPKTNRNFTQFWYESLDCDELDLGSNLQDLISCSEHRVQDEECYISQKRRKAGSAVLHLGRDHIGSDSVYCRVHQVSNIIRNLSFDAANAVALSESPLVFNFTLLCCHSSYPQLKRNGMDLLANISKKYILPAIHESSTQLVIRSVYKWIQSTDKLELVNALQTIAMLSQVEQNEDILVESLSRDIYVQVIALARLYDLQLIVASLDALYYLSEIGEGPCESIAGVRYSIDFLFNLITVETRSFGESALGGIIVRDHGVPSQSQAHQPPRPHSRPIGTMMGPPAAPSTSRPLSRTHQGQPMHALPPRPVTPPAAVTPPPPHAAALQRSPQSQAPFSPHYRPGSPSSVRPGLLPPQKHILPATPQNLASMSPEQVACNWLRANYEPYPGALVLTAKIHHEYVTWLQRRGGLLAHPVSPNIFVSCVKKVFPYSELVPSGVESQLQGIRWKPPQHLQPASTPSLRPTNPLPPAYNSQHMLASGNAAVMPPRVSSPSSQPTDVMLRSMLLGEPVDRPRSNSSTSSTLSTKAKSSSHKSGRRGGLASSSTSPRSRSIGDSPLPPVSPASSMELQVCGTAEKVESFVNGASLAKIERVENPLPVSTTPSSKSNQKSSKKLRHDVTPCLPSDASPTDNPDGKQNGVLAAGNDHSSNDSISNSGDKCSGENMNTADSSSQSTKLGDSKGVEQTTPRGGESLNSAPICNGSVSSDSDSMHAEPGKAGKKLTNGTSHLANHKKADIASFVNGEGDGLTKPLLSKNGFINGLEKMIASIPDERPLPSLKQPTEHRRHYSGDSLASQSSSSTQLSVSHNSQSSDKPDPPDTFSNQRSPHNLSTNQLSVQDPSANQSSGKSTPVTLEQSPNHIPTVVDSISNSVTPPLKSGIIVPTQPLNPVTVCTADTPLTSSKLPLVSPASSSGRKSASRKRRRSNASTDSRQSLPDSAGQYKCLWELCGSYFSTCSLLRKHVSGCHTNQAGTCLWTGCDKMERKRWALVSHVSEKHTSDSALAKALADREKGIVPTQSAQQCASIYTPQASRIAITRNYPKPPYPEFMDAREGPVTKHIRFTAALILRNICRYSSTGRALLKKHESDLALIAGSAMEASSPIVNCLWEIQQVQRQDS